MRGLDPALGVDAGAGEPVGVDEAVDYSRHHGRKLIMPRAIEAARASGDRGDDLGCTEILAARVGHA